jgi:phosphoglycerol transferase MdoB-like AlkP superfamily enzyme
MFLTKWHRRLIKRLLFLLIPYTCLRVGFYFYHSSVYKQFAVSEILMSILLGVRFDIAAICLLNLSVILLAQFQATNPKFLKFDRLLFVFVNTLGFLVSLDDYELFLFMGKRLGSDIFAIGGDVVDQLPQITASYWYFPVIALIMGVGLYSFDRRFIADPLTKEKFSKQILSGIFVLGLIFLGMRGGPQRKSINVQSAFVQGRNELGHLVLNTPYHFLRTLKTQRPKKLSYFTNEEGVRFIKEHRPSVNDYKGEDKWNVVFIILESFGLEFVEEGYAPFLKKLQEKSLSFDRHLANGRRSIESLPSLLCGLPSLIDDPISKSSFGSNKFVCMPRLLKEKGYTNHFYHAGARGTMGFEAYALATGFDRYFAKEDYPDQEDYDGTWGIYDEPYLQYVVRELDKMQGPFMAAVFTLSSHQPYAIPEKYQGKFPKGELEIHESIGYTDHALEEFFKKAEDRPWFKKTLFVITADHAQKNHTEKFKNLLGYYRVPFLLYAPGHEWEKVHKKVTHHSDIPITVLDFVGADTKGLPATGASMLSGKVGVGLGYAEGATYFLARENDVLLMGKDGEQFSSTYNWETGHVGPQQKSQDPLLKSYLQYFINGLIDNNLSL